MNNISAAIVHARSALALADCDNDDIPDNVLPTLAIALFELRDAADKLEIVAAAEAGRREMGL